MKFKYIKFSNFLSFIDEQYIDLESDGITIVQGVNNRDLGSCGSGKSAAIVDSIVYALFGRTTKNLKIEQVINNITRKNMFVEICFYIGNDEYIIKRYREHDTLKNQMIVLKNKEDITQEGKRDTQKLVESIIKVNFKSFVSSIVLSQERTSNFAESDNSERKKIIENLLMYDFITKYHKATKEVIRVLRKNLELNELLYTEKTKLKQTLESNVYSYIDKCQNEIENRKSEISVIDKKIASLLKKDFATEKKNRELLKETKTVVNEKEILLTKKDREISQIDNEINTIDISISNLKTQLKKLNKDPNICPVCGSEVEGSKLESYISTNKNNMLELEEKKKEYAKRKGLLKKEKLKLEEDLNKSKDVMRGLNIDPTLTDDEIAESNSLIENLKKKKDILGSQLEFDIDNDDYVNGITLQITESSKDISSVKRKLRAMKHEMEYYEFWRDRLSNDSNSMKTYCANYVLQSLNKFISHYIKFFNFDMKYQLNSELEDIIIKDGRQVVFDQLSGGEKRTIELCLIFSLYEITRIKMPDSINVLVLDELLSSRFDDVRIDSIKDILDELLSKNIKLFVIDHKNSLKETLDCDIITVVKNKAGVSSLETV